MIIRPLQPDDVHWAADIARQSDLLPWQENCLQACFRDSRYQLWAGLNQSRGVAFAVTASLVDESELLCLAVEPLLRRQGYAKALMQHIIAHLPQQSYKLWLEVRAANQAAINLYQAMGFIYVRTRRDYYPKGDLREDAQVFCRTT